MGRLFGILFTFSLLVGCASHGPVFSWYHPEGGEYLFAYDNTACTEAVEQMGQALGSRIDGPYFTCMLERGYYLVDGDEIVQAPSGAPSDRGPQVTLQ